MFDGYHNKKEKYSSSFVPLLFVFLFPLLFDIQYIVLGRIIKKNSISDLSYKIYSENHFWTKLNQNVYQKCQLKRQQIEPLSLTINLNITCILLHAAFWETYFRDIGETFGNTQEDQQIILKSNYRSRQKWYYVGIKHLSKRENT